MKRGKVHPVRVPPGLKTEDGKLTSSVERVKVKESNLCGHNGGENVPEEEEKEEEGAA